MKSNTSECNRNLLKYTFFREYFESQERPKWNRNFKKYIGCDLSYFFIADEI